MLEIDRCEQNCRNTLGSYNCSCNTGYTLNSDGYLCHGACMQYKVEGLLFSYLVPFQTTTSAAQMLRMLANTHATMSLAPTLVSAMLDSG